MCGHVGKRTGRALGARLASATPRRARGRRTARERQQEGNSRARYPVQEYLDVRIREWRGARLRRVEALIRWDCGKVRNG